MTRRCRRRRAYLWIVWAPQMHAQPSFTRKYITPTFCVSRVALKQPFENARRVQSSLPRNFRRINYADDYFIAAIDRDILKSLQRIYLFIFFFFSFFPSTREQRVVRFRICETIFHFFPLHETSRAPGAISRINCRRKPKWKPVTEMVFVKFK